MVNAPGCLSFRNESTPNSRSNVDFIVDWDFGRVRFAPRLDMYDVDLFGGRGVKDGRFRLVVVGVMLVAV